MSVFETTMLNTDAMRRVPHDLLPVKVAKYTISWGRKTFKYAHLFDSNLQSTAYKDDQEVGRWVQTALKMNEELKIIGYNSGVEEIISIASNEYNLKMPSCNTSSPTSFDDIITIVSNKVWYECETKIKHRIIHRLCYGIFRQGRNGWAKSAATKWCKLKQIVMDQDSVEETSTTNEMTTLKKRRIGKGFVYSTMVSRVSNSISDRFNNVCKQSHGEFIAVRKPQLLNGCTYTLWNCHGSNAYLVTFPSSGEVDMVEMEQKKRTLKRSLIEAISAGMAKQDIDNLVSTVIMQHIPSETIGKLKLDCSKM
jgi:hypothetical protein